MRGGRGDIGRSSASTQASMRRSPSPHRDDEQTRIGEQGLAVRLDGISLLEAAAVAGEKLAALVVVKPLEERLKGRTGKPVGDALRPVERMDVGRHPYRPPATRPGAAIRNNPR